MKVITAKVVERGGIRYLRLPDELVFPEPTLQLQEIAPGEFLIKRDTWLGVKDAAKMVLSQNRKQPKKRESAFSKRTKKKRD